MESLSSLCRERRVSPAPGYKTKLFKNVDLTNFTLYDKYTRLLEALICRTSAREGIAAPFVAGPPERANQTDEEWAKVERDLARENDGDGYLNFADIL